ncbi:MAG: tRNA preQ1(34) S-adenosylmethionine ribosyltransferase-isomerase QueA [Pseudomonadota bacterium]
MQLADFDYHLPDELIARYPAPERRDSRLLHVGAALDDLNFHELPSLLEPGDRLVLNDTRVIRARLHGSKDTGGRIELLVERVTGVSTALAHIKASKSPKPGTRLHFANAATATVLGRDGALFEVEFDTQVLALLDRQGEVPLPPYLDREAEASDIERYQTVYAREPGAVAAPTAGLHFDDALFDELDAMGVQRSFVTLHVGAGTFQSLREADIDNNHLHSERVTVTDEAAEEIRTTRRDGGRIVAVGTTAVRSLEAASAASGDVAGFQDETDLFIRPGYRFRCVDAMITNFHLPQSSLMMLVAAFAGRERVLNAYRHAVDQRYRFFSYGDSMLLEPTR